jgi:orotate phosphoribosyltransferase
VENKDISKILLEKKAVILNTQNPFTFVSGIRSPIYCDLRTILGYPKERDIIVDGFLGALKDIDFEVLAGTATAGIPWATLVADKLKQPMAYIRGGKKNRGMGKQIEGGQVSGKKVIVIEDLISTGGSSFKAVEAAREAGASVAYIIAVLTYEFQAAEKRLRKGKCNMVALTNFSSLVRVAFENNYLKEDELNTVLEWNKDPAKWGPEHGFPNADPKW